MPWPLSERSDLQTRSNPRSYLQYPSQRRAFGCTDSSNGGDPLVYGYHDYLLRAFIENWHKTTPADILRWYKAGTLASELGCTQEAINEACPDAAALIADLERWWKLFAGFAVAKRIQAPPVLSLTKRAFGYDHREAQLTPYFSREYYELKEELLK